VATTAIGFLLKRIGFVSSIAKGLAGR